jgi:acetylornithine/succinyldiaminopimelate/putrescine aminotransferase
VTAEALSFKETITRTFARHVSSGKVEFFRQAGVEVVFGRREGIYLWDLDGKPVMDFHCNGGVFNLGHRHPRVIAALLRAVEHVDIGNHHFVSRERAALAERLAASTPGDLDRVIFGVGGGEAIDMAVKLARASTGRPEIISAQGGYHGHTGLALAAGDDRYAAPFGPLAPGFRRVPFGDLDALGAALGEATAAVLFETIPATLGIALPPADYFAGVRRLCDARGALMIIDEVQTGLGRCGDPWAIMGFEVVPDILVTAKGLSGGAYPISATVYREPLNPFMHEHPFIHVSTFGGSEIGCRVALEVLDLLEEPGFLPHVRTMAAFFAEGLSQAQARHAALVTEIRQRGLMMGLRMVNPMGGPLFTQAGLKQGLLAIYANHDTSVVQLLPPLVITPAEAQSALEIIEATLADVERALGL